MGHSFTHHPKYTVFTIYSKQVSFLFNNGNFGNNIIILKNFLFILHSVIIAIHFQKKACSWHLTSLATSPLLKSLCFLPHSDSTSQHFALWLLKQKKHRFCHSKGYQQSCRHFMGNSSLNLRSLLKSKKSLFRAFSSSELSTIISIIVL